ncbi:MAG: HNH endonuclease signature motif containing protein [Aeromicrobium sp.]
MATCVGCGQELLRPHQKKFCSNKCQRAQERDKRTREWLESGETPNVTGPYTHFIKYYLFEAQHGCCAICGSEAHWMGMRLILVLDHIDGDSTNNARDNLRMVCPNCDSQLPTFKARNRGKGRHWRRERYANGQSY